MTNPDRPTPASARLTQGKQGKKDQPHHDLDADALIALELARNLKPGLERAEAMKRAGSLRHAADLHGVTFPKRGRPKKT